MMNINKDLCDKCSVKMKFERIEESRKPKLVPISREMNELQIELSKELKSLFPEYLNKLNLISSNDTLLTIDSEGNGTFKDYIKSFNYILLSNTYLNANENIEVMCDKGHIYNTTFSRFKCQNQRCPYCKGTIKYTYEEVKNYIESFGYKLLSTEYNNARERLLVKCECGNEYFVSFTNFKTGSRCYECRKVKWSKEKIIEYITNHTDFEFIEFIEYKKGISTLKLKCEHGHEFISNFNRVKYKGCGCPECKTSKGEQRIEEILIKYNLEYKKQHRFQDCRFKYPLPFDFYLPKQNCCIEYDGEQHYVAIDHFGGYEKLLETKRNDEIKNQYCKDNNINLIRIPYLEFDNIENILINKLK